MPDLFTAAVALLGGVALSASCGFRVFVPMFVMAIAVKAGMIQLAPGFNWIGTWPGLLLLGSATALEVGGYYVPWLDNALDSVASPAAVVAGTLVTASFITGMDPMLKWTLALVAGGGAAGGVQAITVTARAASAATTGGMGNPVVSTVENVSSTILSVLAIVVPIIAGLLVIALAYLFYRKFLRKRPAVAVVTPTVVAAGGPHATA